MQSETLELRGVLVPGDIIRCYYFQALRRTWLWLLLAALIPLAGLPLAVLIIRSGPNPDLHPLFQSTWLPLSLLVILLIHYAVRPYLGARRTLRLQKHVLEPVTFSFTNESIVSTRPSAGAVIAWNVIVGMRETKSLFVLYETPTLCIIIPKRFFENAAAIDSWRRIVAAHLPPKQIARPGLVARFC